MRDAHWTARDFLKAAWEFDRMTPDRESWTEALLASNPPGLVRLQRLRALAKAFRRPARFQDFVVGKLHHEDEAAA
ncbi:hypothetical protein ACN28I_30465 [Archangium gephyra]|uniref:hypothetical protein n=1 Tax=Archangium gephyra TaxID=48 RepID=UPI003B7BEA7E